LSFWNEKEVIIGVSSSSAAGGSPGRPVFQQVAVALHVRALGCPPSMQGAFRALVLPSFSC
jgi:hypothetical protein